MLRKQDEVGLMLIVLKTTTTKKTKINLLLTSIHPTASSLSIRLKAQEPS